MTPIVASWAGSGNSSNYGFVLRSLQDDPGIVPMVTNGCFTHYYRESLAVVYF